MPRDRKTRRPTSVAKIAPDFAWEMIVIDQEPLRAHAAGECAEAMLRLEDARAGWHRFEREDKPAFARWRAREFGTLLSKAREVEVRLRDCQALIHEVEMEMRRGFQDAHSAYQRVMFRRENPGAAPLEEPETSPNESVGDRRMSDFEKEALFQEWVQKSLGTNPDKMDDEAYSTTFEAFKMHMFRGPREEPRPTNSRRQPAVDRAFVEEEETEEPAATVDARVKQIYRILVRRLHPDLRGDGVAAAGSLWHEVQEAYAASDVARMEILLALSEITANQLGDGTSLGQMHSVRAELERLWCALEKSLLEAEGEDAWNFARNGPAGDLRLRVQRELKSDLAARSLRLDLLTRTIAGWAAGPMANLKAMPARPTAFRAW